MWESDERWQAAEQAVTVFRARDLEKFCPMLGPLQIIYRNPRRVALIKQQ